MKEIQFQIDQKRANAKENSIKKKSTRMDSREMEFIKDVLGRFSKDGEIDWDGAYKEYEKLVEKEFMPKRTLQDLKAKFGYIRKQERKGKSDISASGMASTMSVDSEHLIEESELHFIVLLQKKVQVYYLKTDPVPNRKFVNISFLEEKLSRDFPNLKCNVIFSKLLGILYI